MKDLLCLLAENENCLCENEHISDLKKLKWKDVIPDVLIKEFAV